MRILMPALEDRLYTLVARLAPWILPGNRIIELFGDLVDQPDIPPLERVRAVRHMVGSEWTRKFYPGIRVNDEMPFGQRVANFGRLYLSICRISGMWLAGYYAAAATGTWMLPDVYGVDLWLPLIFGSVGVMLFYAYRDAFISRPKRDEFLLISVRGYLEKLKQWIDTLLTGIWCQGTGRSFLETLLFLFMSLGPVVALIRWTSGYPLAREQGWVSVGFRMVGVLIMMVTWSYVKEANRLVSKILEDEFGRTESDEPAE